MNQSSSEPPAPAFLTQELAPDILLPEVNFGLRKKTGSGRKSEFGFSTIFSKNMFNFILYVF